MGFEHIFRAYDIRGTWGDELNARRCLDIGSGLASFLIEDLGFSKVAIGQDIRTTSRTFHGAVVSALLSSGLDVLDAGTCAFGVAMFAGLKGGVDASLYITASHLGPEWNGLKAYFGDGVGFPEEHIVSIGRRVMEGRTVSAGWDEQGKYSIVEALDGYIAFWRDHYGHKVAGRGLSVGVDPGGGAMCLSASQVLNAVGARVMTVNGDVDPLFRNRPSEPRPKELGALKDLVMDSSLSFGVAFDGDGDRAVVVDDTGRFLSTDRLGTLIARSLVIEKGGGTVLANVESSMALEDVLVPLGARVKRIKVGHTFLTLEAKLERAIFGVEKSGHLIVPEHVLFDDAIVAPLEVLRMLSMTGRPLHELVDSVPEHPSASVAVDCPDGLKFAVVARLAERFKGSYERVNTQDGVRVDLEDGWALIRCSNTSPVIRLTVEARSDGSLGRIKSEFEGLLKEEMGR